jgi:hypothetical protein
MSDYITEDDFENKLSLVIRKPQEGKTFICISNITKDTTRNIHLVLTMNTLASGMQFFGRMEESIGCNRIIVFNSKKDTAGNCHHAKSVVEVLELIRNNNDIKVIVCCAHEKRIRNSMPKLLSSAMDSISFTQENRKFIIHIDEAHKYIPENRQFVRDFNSLRIVTDIIGYSGSPDGIWVNNRDDILFHRIHVTDVQKELDIIRSPDYFGVHRCDFHIYDDIDCNELITSVGINTVIPGTVFSRANMGLKNRTEWYGAKFAFDIGNELLYLSFIKSILGEMEIPHDSYSYNFVPAYTRKATHYQIAEILLEQFGNANVIVMNGNGIELYRKRPDSTASYRVTTDLQINHRVSEDERKRLLEPSYVIQKLIEPTRNCPTFVTGLTCVGMSVTLINQDLGNFDNVIMAHQHLSSDKLYQLCRFLFNYTSWSEESKQRIKMTKFHSLTKVVVDTCLHYEQHVEILSNDFAGRSCTLREVDGLEEEEPCERELKKKLLSSVKLTNPDGKMWKKFKVYDGNDAEIWAQVGTFYSSICGKALKGKSRPTPRADGYYYCSTTKHVDKQRNDDIKNMEKQSWWSTFQLLPNRFTYARVFVGYDNLEDNSDYTIYVKYVCLESSENTRVVLSKYGKKCSSSSSSSSSDDISRSSSSSSDESDVDV